jgi:signal transduction histidine kinase
VRDLRVRTKLAAVLTIPLIGFLVVTGLQVASSVRSAVGLDELSQHVALGREVTSLIHELQRERDRTAGMLAGIGGTSPTARNFAELAPEHTAVDRAVTAYTRAAQPLGRDQASAEIEAGLTDLARIRDGARSGWLSRQAVFDAYTRIIASLEALVAVPPGAGGDLTLARAVGAFANASRVKELAAQIRGRLYALCSAGTLAPGEFEAVADVRAQRQAAIDRLRSDADPAQLTAYDEVVSGQAVRNASRLEQTVVDNARAGALQVDAQQWWQASTTTLELMRRAETRLLDDAVRAAQARTAAQWRTTALSSLASILLLLLAVLLSVAIGRTMVDTLHSLREQAHDIARRRLPQIIDQLRGSRRGVGGISVEPVAIRSSDEIGEVADAFTAVHRSAVRLAVEQALMRQNVDAIFVNLARRSQTLVERQLRLLDTLEASETDPDQLTHLFRLDHLATRMRRNHHNLLVPAGGEASRRWAEPVPLATIVLAAMAEIEQYTRVKHDITDDVHVVGHAVADVVHLVAELLDNATIFSPPDSTVTVLGWAADERGAALVIEDEGIGMSPEAVAAANRQLETPVSIDSATAERMGLVVVGHLAHRHGIRVELRSGRKGVIAHLAFPPELLADAPAAPPPESDPARWLRTERPSPVVDGPDGDGDAEVSTGSPDAAGPGGAAPRRRATPMRAEDVLGVGQRDGASVWWSRGGAAATGSRPTVRPAPSPQPKTNGAGLPVREPMAHLPGLQPAAVGLSHDDAAVLGRPPEEPDPHEVHGVLSRFYGGVHRAAAEDETKQRVT